MKMVDLDSFENVLFCYTKPESPDGVKIEVNGHQLFVVNAIAHMLIKLDEEEVNAICNIVNAHWAENGADDKERVDRAIVTGKGVVECIKSVLEKELPKTTEEIYTFLGE